MTKRKKERKKGSLTKCPKHSTDGVTKTPNVPWSSRVTAFPCYREWMSCRWPQDEDLPTQHGIARTSPTSLAREGGKFLWSEARLHLFCQAGPSTLGIGSNSFGKMVDSPKKERERERKGREKKKEREKEERKTNQHPYRGVESGHLKEKKKRKYSDQVEGRRRTRRE